MNAAHEAPTVAVITGTSQGTGGGVRRAGFAVVGVARSIPPADADGYLTGSGLVLVAAHAAATQAGVLVSDADFGTCGTVAGLDAGREHAAVMASAVAAADLAHSVLPGMLARRCGGIITNGRPYRAGLWMCRHHCNAPPVALHLASATMEDLAMPQQLAAAQPR